MKGAINEGDLIVSKLVTAKNRDEMVSELQEGKIVSFAKVRSRKKSVRELACLYAERVVDAENQIIAISHADCKDEAEALRELVCAEKPPKQVVMVCHEPATGSHVGPGMLAVYFLGNERIL